MRRKNKRIAIRHHWSKTLVLSSLQTCIYVFFFPMTCFSNETDRVKCALTISKYVWLYVKNVSRQNLVLKTRSTPTGSKNTSSRNVVGDGGGRVCAKGDGAAAAVSGSRGGGTSRACDSVEPAAEVPGHTRPVGIRRGSLTGSCRRRRRRSWSLSAGRSVGRSAAARRSVGRSVGRRRVGRPVVGHRESAVHHQRAAAYSITRARARARASRVPGMWSDLPTTTQK